MPAQTTFLRLVAPRLLTGAVLLALAGCGGSTEPTTNPIPTVQSITAVEGDSLVMTINGTGYVATSFAMVNRLAVITRVISKTRLEARVPIGGARQFEVVVSVMNPAPGGGSSQDVPFSWTAAPSPLPTLTAMSPAFALTGADSVVDQLTGTGFVRQTLLFDPSTFVTYPVRLVSATAAQVTLPRAFLAQPRAVPLRVSNAPPGGGTSAPVSFEVRAPVPIVAALRQPSAPVGMPAVTLVVDGSGFIDSSVVLLNGSRRPTRRVAAGTLEATLTDTDLADVGALQVSVSNAGPGGGTSNAATFTVTGVVPTVSLLPATGGTVGGGFTLGVHGAGFARNSIVRWNGADLVTDYRNGTRLFATVPDALMRAPGVASITVFSPGAGGGSSTPVSFTIRSPGSTTVTLQSVNVLGADVAYSGQTGALYASVRATDSLYPNRLVQIDPVAGTVTRSVAIGTDPRLLAMADDGRQLYVGVDGQNSVRRIDVTTFVPGLELPMARDGFFGPSYAADIAVVPGKPRSVAVTQYYRGVSPPLAGTTIFDDAVPRASTGPGHTGGSRIEFAGPDTLLFGYNNLSTGFNLFTFKLDASGLTILRDIGSLVTGFYTDIVGAAGRVYSTDGVVVDAERQSQAGRFAGGGALYVDPTLGRAFSANSGRINVIDINTFATIGSVTVPDLATGFDPFGTNSVTHIVRCGAQCLAWADGNKVVIARSAIFGQ